MILESYLENELVNECTFLLNENILDENDIKYLLDEKENLAIKVAKKIVSRKQKRANVIAMNNLATTHVLRKKLKKAQTKKDVDIVLTMINKNIKGVSKYRHSYETKGNIIPFANKKIKKMSFDKFLRDMDKLKLEAQEKRKTLR